MKTDYKVNYFLYSFSSFYRMTYKSYFFEYSSYCSFGVFWGVSKCYSILYWQCLKWHLGSETVPSATLSAKLWLILVISNYFFMQIEFVTRISERLLGTKCFTFSGIVHKFCLRFKMVLNFVPSATYGYFLP